MKKLFYAIIAACSLFAATSCGDKDEANNESLDGRWDVYTDLHKDCQTFTFVFDGNKVEAYIIFWGDCLKGTYTYVDNKFEFNFKIEDAFDARIPEDYTGEIDQSGRFIDPETLKPVKGYSWLDLSLQMFDEDVEMLKGWEFERESSKSGKGSDGHQSLTFVKK